MEAPAQVSSSSSVRVAEVRGPAENNFRVASKWNVKVTELLSYRHDKNPRHQTCRWRSLWKRDIPLHFGDEGKGFISFGADRTDGSLISLCTSVENEFIAYLSALSFPNVAVDFISVSIHSSTH
ncbi:hypothetical protein AVEN_200636-1 [Araneus ventricosus]|uniref:Uncharacterized protein n=1 Tax=Araneus ventricosus TaxID=182803 RepID=A0A4Y2RPN3_ARAVE|nr:hypothetical protein AVEN_200636-1 [Araneus ventricosus]